nr:hypothetical protein [Candidatus Njordarchaeota archaeon]
MARVKADKPSRNEKSYYPLLKAQFEKLFRSKGRDIHLEVTSDRAFSNTLKSRISNHRQIIFYFLREAAPDITGFVSSGTSADFVVIEVKDEVIRLDHIYQTRKYADLLDAKFSFLVTTKEIPEEIKRLSKAVFSLLS